MSQQGMQRTQAVLQVVNSQLPSIFQASETHGLDLTAFLYGTIVRAGLQPTAEVWTFIAALNGLIGPKDAAPQSAVQGSPQPLDTTPIPAAS